MVAFMSPDDSVDNSRPKRDAAVKAKPATLGESRTGMRILPLTVVTPEITWAF